jgi:hypothetical protein
MSNKIKNGEVRTNEGETLFPHIDVLGVLDHVDQHERGARRVAEPHNYDHCSLRSGRIE